ncbi:MAG: flagellar protein FliS [Acidobacteriota bacterium]
MHAFARQPQVQKMNPYALTNKYQQEELLNLSPVQIILKLYDLVLVSCKKDDKKMAIRALNELIVALNFEHAEMSTGFYRLYEYSKRCVFAGRYIEVINVISELRAAWAQAFNLK